MKLYYMVYETGRVKDPYGKQPYAVCSCGRIMLWPLCIVGFNPVAWTKRVFRMIPGLEQAEFVRYVLSSGTYINSPCIKNDFTICWQSATLLYRADDGVEGYVESAAMGLIAGRCCASGSWQRASDLAACYCTRSTGTLYHQRRSDNFQPMNVNFACCRPCPAYTKETKETGAGRACFK